jgi:hypothetical protein
VVERVERYVEAQALHPVALPVNRQCVVALILDETREQRDASASNDVGRGLSWSSHRVRSASAVLADQHLATLNADDELLGYMLYTLVLLRRDGRHRNAAALAVALRFRHRNVRDLALKQRRQLRATGMLALLGLRAQLVTGAFSIELFCNGSGRRDLWVTGLRLLLFASERQQQLCGLFRCELLAASPVEQVSQALDLKLQPVDALRVELGLCLRRSQLAGRCVEVRGELIALGLQRSYLLLQLF